MRQQNSSKLVYYVLGAAAFIYGAVTLTSGGDSSSSGKRPSVSSGLTAKTSTDSFNAEDYKARFQPVSSMSKDGFKPIVYRKSANGMSAAPNAIPPEYANGESDWVYTGTGGIDGNLQASFENPKTGEYVLVSKGERWKKCVVEKITDGSVLLEGPNTTKNLELPSGEVVAGNAAANPVAPVNPALNGAIGMANDAQAGDIAGAKADQAMQDMQFGGMQGGRRGGRRGGFGGGGGGGRFNRGGGAAPAPAAAPGGQAQSDVVVTTDSKASVTIKGN